MGGGEAVFIVLLIIFFIALISLILLWIGYRKAESSIFHFINDRLEMVCEKRASLQYLPFTQAMISAPADQINWPLAQSLFASCLKTTLMNCADNVKSPPTTIPQGFDSLTYLHAPNPFVKGVNSFFGTVFHSKSLQTTMVVFSGTMSIPDWVDDFSYKQDKVSLIQFYQNLIPLPVQTPGSGTTTFGVHEGFFSILKAISKPLFDEIQTTNYPNLIISGHSLGGALATMYGMQAALLYPNKNIIHYTFAAPKSGDNLYAHNFNLLVPQSHRFANLSDIVPSVPLAASPVVDLSLHSALKSESIIEETEYTQTGGYEWFQINLGSLGDNHSRAYTLFLASKNGLVQ